MRNVGHERPADVLNLEMDVSGRTMQVQVEARRVARCGPPAPPHSTRCSWARISTLPKFGPHFLERNRDEPTNRIGRQPIALIFVFAVPAAGECLDDSRCLSAMHSKRFIEVGARDVILETLIHSNVVGEFSAEIVV